MQIARAKSGEKSISCLETLRAVESFCLECTVLTAQMKSADEWVAAIEKPDAQMTQIDSANARAAHEQWWAQIWSRSHVRIQGTPEADIVTRGYELQRFMHTCSGGDGWPSRMRPNTTW